MTSLSAQERFLFRQQGFLGPFTLCPPAAMQELKPALEAVLRTPPPDHPRSENNRHLDQALIRKLVTHPEILARLRVLYGPDLLLWRTNFFVKDPGSKEIPWHQDFNFWPLEPPVIVSVWIAIDRASVENSCVRLIPGSHRLVVPHTVVTDDSKYPGFGIEAAPNLIDDRLSVAMELEPGQFFIFNERTLHGSPPNRSDKTRLGLTARFVVPLVQVMAWDSPNHALMLVSGQDPIGQNRVLPLPKD